MKTTFRITLDLTIVNNINNEIGLANIESLIEEQWQQTASSIDGDIIKIISVEESSGHANSE